MWMGFFIQYAAQSTGAQVIYGERTKFHSQPLQYTDIVKFISSRYTRILGSRVAFLLSSGRPT
jgi:hypothetical protein